MKNRMCQNSDQMMDVIRMVMLADAPLVAPVDNTPLAAPVEPPVAPRLDGDGVATHAHVEATEGAANEKTKRVEQMRILYIRFLVGP